MNKVIGFLLVFIVTGFCNPSKDSTETVDSLDISFNHSYLALEAGEVYPMGDLADAVDNSYYLGLNFRYSFLKNADGIVMFHYSYFEPVSDEIPYDGVHQFMGKVGVDVFTPLIKSLAVGFGFACNWTRADYDGEALSYESLGATLTDNETEFGWFLRLNLKIWNFENFRIGLNVMWEELWTLPKRSDMLYVGVVVERKLW